jgi:hypothetical protein
MINMTLHKYINKARCFGSCLTWYLVHLILIAPKHFEIIVTSVF